MVCLDFLRDTWPLVSILAPLLFLVGANLVTENDQHVCHSFKFSSFFFVKSDIILGNVYVLEFWKLFIFIFLLDLCCSRCFWSFFYIKCVTHCFFGHVCLSVFAVIWCSWSLKTWCDHLWWKSHVQELCHFMVSSLLLFHWGFENVDYGFSQLRRNLFQK